MMTADRVLELARSIEEHASAPSENERLYVRRCREIIDRDGALSATAVVVLYEILDGLDARAGLFESDWDAVEDEFA
jgi:hypothetical protein